MNWKNLTLEEVAEFQCVKDWLMEVATRRTGSEGTQRVYLKRLTDYVNYRKKTPDKLVAEGDAVAKGKRRTTVAEYQLTKYFRWLEREQKLKRGTAKSKYGAIRSFLRYNEIPFFGKTPTGISRARSHELAKKKLKQAVDAANLYEKYVVCGMACTGMRPGDFVKLVYGDVREDFEAGKERLYIEKQSEKEDLWFGVFLNRQATKYLRQLLEERKRSGEIFNDNTPLLTHRRKGRTGAISTWELARIVREAGARVGLKITPKTFRKNFRTNASPRIGRDATCKMAAWKIPGVGGSYFLPPRSKCLELYVEFESMFTYEEEVEEEVELRVAKRLLEGQLKAAGIDPKKILRVKKCKTTAEEVIALQEALGKKRGAIGGGLPFELQARKALADIVLGAIKDVKEKLAENS